MLDNDYGISAVSKTLKYIYKSVYVGSVQTCSRFVQYIHCLARTLLLSSVASFTLCASPPDSVVDDCPSCTYDSPTSYKVCSLFLILGILSKLKSFLDGHFQYIGNCFPFIFYLKRFPVISFSSAYIAGNIYIGQEFISIFIIPSPQQASHLPPFTLKLIGLLYSLSFCFVCLCIQIPYHIEKSRICCRIWSRRSSYWRLVYIYYFI